MANSQTYQKTKKCRSCEQLIKDTLKDKEFISNMLNDVTLVGIVGYARSGKDTAGLLLVEYLGYKRQAFADHLKMIATELGWRGSKGKVGRRFLQLLGEALRTLDPAYFIRKISLSDKTVITDVRFENEAKFILQNKGILLVIDRKSVKPRWWHRPHVSEQYHKWINKYTHYVIDNNGGLVDLKNNLGIHNIHRKA